MGRSGGEFTHSKKISWTLQQNSINPDNKTKAQKPILDFVTSYDTRLGNEVGLFYSSRVHTAHEAVGLIKINP